MNVSLRLGDVWRVGDYGRVILKKRKKWVLEVKGARRVE